ncbi:12085_t:CDS:2 [Entrophospora sp. SA101]|nr:12085_t:CDS:2 [Entrophospora sp. SA101]CAJ0900633.1 3387_t:CDS:2 [Entrophospora sp. SA101]CAJ0900691.1 3395_t:CDS:2 [Entrophospora sp. SA101]
MPASTQILIKKRLDQRSIREDYTIDYKEADTLHLQHYLFKSYWRSNFSAPVEKMLRDGNANVLEIGTGPATWCLEMGTEYPLSKFIGIEAIEMVPLYPKDVMPPNCRFMQCDYMSGLPFEDESFDFIHMKIILLPFAEKNHIQAFVNEIIRILKPTGYLEIMKVDLNHCNQGPISQKLFEALTTCFDENFNLNINNKTPNIVEILSTSTNSNNLSNITQEIKPIPVGNRSGSLGKMALEGLCNIWQILNLSSSMGITDQEYDELMESYEKEVDSRTDKNEDTKSFMSRSYEHEKVAWDLFCQGMEAISLLPEEPVVNYENYDDLPDVPQE